MKLRTMTLILIIISMPMAVLAGGYSSNDLADTKDKFVYVVALEKDHPNQPGTMWSPTLYKISVEEGKIVKQVKIADQGAPITCESVGDTNIRIILHEGVFSNGTKPGKPITKEITINKDTMDIVESKTEQGIDLSNYATDVLRRKRKAPETIISKVPKGMRFLASSSKKSRVFVLTGSRMKGDLTVKILDANSFQEIETIPLNVGDRKLGGFSGVVNTALLRDQFLAFLFRGDSSIDKFGPGYVVIVDLTAKSVKYVAVGSNPALGISY